MSEAHAISLLKRGIANARAGEKALARNLLQQSAELNPDNDAVWLWLAVTAATDEEKIHYLKRALSINPANEWVKATLSQLQAKLAKRAPAWKGPLCMAPDMRPQHQCKSCKAVLSLSELNEILKSDADVSKMQRAIKGYGSVIGQGVAFGAHYNMALAHLNLTEFDLDGDNTFDAADIAILESMTAQVIVSGVMNGSGHFEVETSGLGVGVDYYLMRTSSLNNPSYQQVDQVTAGSDTDTLTDDNPPAG